MGISLKEFARLLNAELENDNGAEIHGIAPIDSAGPGEVTFFSNKRYEKHLATTHASALIAPRSIALNRSDIALLKVDDPYLGFVVALRYFHPGQQDVCSGVHPSAVIDPSVVLHPAASVGPNAVIKANVVIGERSVICAGAYIGQGVRIGKDCVVYANVTILAAASLGNRVIVHSGTTIGSDGFGFAPAGKAYEKIPQVGSVVIEDDVEIGANSAIDRGTIGNTIIHSGTKLDNLIQIAHNVEIGENTVIAAQSGVSGSTTIGNHVMIAGQVGVVGHIEIGDEIKIGAQAGVSKSVFGEGKTFRGSPARELHDELRQEAANRQLPELIALVRSLEARLKELEQSLKDLSAEA